MDVKNLPQIVLLPDEQVIHDVDLDLDLVESNPTDHQRDSSDSFDNGSDTDLEIEEPTQTYDATGKRVYLAACLATGVTPVSYFIRHIQEREIILRHHGLGPIGAKAIAIALVSNTAIVKLDLHDNYLSDEGTRVISDMLKENCYISNLDLSCNNIGHMGCIAICDTLHNSGVLLDLNLSNNLFADKDAIVFAEAMKGNDHLISLNLSRNRFSELAGEMIGPSISANDSIECLDLSWNHIRRRGAIAISTGLKSNCTLKVLNLSWNGFEDDGARALCDALKGNNTLTELNIRNNRISSIGATHIARGLEGNNTLEILKIGQNPIKTIGAHSILSAIRIRADSAVHELHLEDVYLDEDFFTLLKTLNESKAVKVIGRSRPTERSPLDQVKQFITNNLNRWMEVFGVYDPDGCGLISKTQFIKGLKEVELSFDKGQMAWLCISLTEGNGTEVNYKKPVLSLKKTTKPTDEASPAPSKKDDSTS